MVNEYIEALEDGEARRLAHTHWGLTLPAETAGGWPCDIGIRIEDGLLRIQAYALAATAEVDPRILLQWNRQTRLVRFSSTRSGDIWILADLSVQAVDATQLDRLLGLTLEGVLAVRALSAP